MPSENVAFSKKMSFKINVLRKEVKKNALTYCIGRISPYICHPKTIIWPIRLGVRTQDFHS